MQAATTLTRAGGAAVFAGTAGAELSSAEARAIAAVGIICLANKTANGSA